MQELGRAQLGTVSQREELRYVLYILNDPHIFLHLQALLGEVAEYHCLAGIDLAAVLLLLAQQHIDERGFTDAVLTNNANAFAFPERIVESLQDHFIAEGFIHFLQLQYLAAEPFHFHGQLQLFLRPLLCSPFFPFVKGILACPGFGGPGLGLLAHPFQLFTVPVPCFFQAGLLLLIADGLLFHILFVISLAGVQRAVVYLYDLVADGFEEIPVVGHQQEGDVISAQVMFQPFYHIHVQVVRGLIQYQQGMAVLQVHIYQYLGKGNALALSAGQGACRLVEVVDVELAQYLPDHRLKVPGIQLVHDPHGLCHQQRVRAVLVCKLFILPYGVDNRMVELEDVI